jgi:general secretion pathway protein D
LAVLAVSAALLASCASSSDQSSRQPTPSAVVQQIREVDLEPRFPRRTMSATATSSKAGESAAIYYGDGSPAAAKAPPGTGAQSAAPDAGPATTGALTNGAGSAGSNKGYEINLENTPVATAAKAILGDILGVGYTIDPRVQGTVNLSSGRAVPKNDLLYVLESALRVSNVALVRDGQGYRLIPSAEAVAAGSIDRAQGPEAGYGISVVPLQFVSAQTLVKLLDNFAAKPGLVRPDPTRNLIVIQGSSADRRAAIDTALNFDADWMLGQSVGVFPVSNSTPEPIISELERIIDAGEGGLSQNVVKLEPISRQNAILVVTRKPEFLKRVETWIKRLDKSGGAGTGVKVYRMRYGDARQVAALLNNMFLGNAASPDTSTNQLAPGGGAIASSSGRSGTRGLQSAVSPSPTTTPTAAGTQQSPSAAPASFNARFADASGGRLAQQGSASSAQGPGAGGGAGALLTNVRITPDSVNNALLIYANQENYRIIEHALQQIDRPQLQVAIDATIAEVTLNDALRYGVQFFMNSKDVGLKPDSGSLLNTAAKAVLSRTIPGFNFLVGTESEPRVIIDALHQVTDVKILSNPSVVVVDNQFATLQVGDQIPITTRTAQSVDVPTAPVVNSIDYRNTGIILRVAPRVNANGNVLLDVEQEISAVANTPTAGTLTPTVSQRKVTSSIAVASGQTVLLAGLISERQDGSRNGIPGLDQIPGIGEFFSTNKSGLTQRTELIIFIRPQIIRNGVDASRIARELRAKLRELRPEPPPPRAAAHHPHPAVAARGPQPPIAPPNPQPPVAARDPKPAGLW